MYDYRPADEYDAVIYLISGVTGINHHHEKDIIEQLSSNRNRIVVIHPRGTGYSDGERGDMPNFSLFITDYVEIITADTDYKERQHPIVLFGHSMSCAILLAIAERIEHVDGAVLINPPYVLKASKGMSPGFGDYIRYAWYYVFAKHKPVVNMAGDPDLIENEQDREEARARTNDPMLVKYVSLYVMMEAKKVMDNMLAYSKRAKYPLLLLYGMEDSIVDKKGCDQIYNAWNCADKQYHTIENGSHGKSTVKLGKEMMEEWFHWLMTQRQAAQRPRENIAINIKD